MFPEGKDATLSRIKSGMTVGVITPCRDVAWRVSTLQGIHSGVEQCRQLKISRAAFLIFQIEPLVASDIISSSSFPYLSSELQ
jgi:hypothetical protein